MTSKKLELNESKNCAWFYINFSRYNLLQKQNIADELKEIVIQQIGM